MKRVLRADGVIAESIVRLSEQGQSIGEIVAHSRRFGRAIEPAGGRERSDESGACRESTAGASRWWPRRCAAWRSNRNRANEGVYGRSSATFKKLQRHCHGHRAGEQGSGGGPETDVPGEGEGYRSWQRTSPKRPRLRPRLQRPASSNWSVWTRWPWRWRTSSRLARRTLPSTKQAETAAQNLHELGQQAQAADGTVYGYRRGAYGYDRR